MNALSQRFEYILIYLTDNRFDLITTVLSAVMAFDKHIFTENKLVFVWRNQKKENPGFPLIVPSFSHLTLINACYIICLNLSF